MTAQTGGAELAAVVPLIAGLLRSEVDRMRAAGVPVGQDDYRGLYISDTEADRLLGLAESTGATVVLRDEAQAVADAVAGMTGRLRKLVDLAGLGPFETACLLLCLACETDLGIERLIAYVQDDVSKRRPRVDLAIRLFAADGAQGAAMDALHPQSPLRAFQLLHLHDELGQPVTPLLAQTLALDAGLQGYLLGGERLNLTIAPWAHRLERAPGLPVPPGVAALAEGLGSLGQPVVACSGPDRALTRAAVAELASRLGRPVMAVEIAGLTAQFGVETALILAEREAALRDAALLLERLEDLRPEDLDAVVTSLQRRTLPAVVALASTGVIPWPGAAMEVPALHHEDRERLWRGALAGLEAPVATSLAGRFHLGADQITRAVSAAHGRAAQRQGEHAVTAEDLFASARDQSTPILSSLARKVTPHYGWGDIVLPPDALSQLHEMCAQVEHRHLVYEIWGFDRKLAMGKGVISLFAGNPGTGKTMAAEIMARALELDLYKIDLSGIVSKYIGETEKNLSAVFAEAETANAILFFDEADALFGKRSEVKDAHDRYANIETAYLLQRLEEYPGLVILATNLKMNLDDAFLRRLHFVVDFPMPEEPERLRILQGCLPDAVPLGGDLDLPFVARQFKISGGNLRNIVLSAAFLAATDRGALGMSHLMRATRREYQKMGRMVTQAEFGDYLALFRRD
ncbi:MAG: ATP-binding protein [Dehalococcoidia bacterium]